MKNKLMDAINKSKDIQILYVEDDQFARESFLEILKMFFSHILVATNGQEGLDLFQENDIDIVLSDITMPVLNGIEMMKQMKNQSSDFKSIFLTAHGHKDILLEAISLNVDGYILKPIDSKQFQDVIIKVINSIYEEKLKHNHQQDQLTKLYNFKKLKLDYSQVDECTLILFNIDNFNFINLTHGYKTGDKIIYKFAQFLLNYTDEDMSLYKLYGDEFMILSTKQDCDATSLAKKIKSGLFEKRYLVDDKEFQISTSVGIVKCTKEKDAELPYYKAKLALQDGRTYHKNSISIYKDDMSLLEKQQELLKWAKISKEALDKDTIKPFYQPMYSFAEKKIVKYESLARIVDDDKIISPYYFLNSIKVMGFLPRLTEAIITETFKYFSNHKDIGFSVNITDDDFKNGEFLKLLPALCIEYDIKPSNVTLEILEDISDYDAKDATDKLQKLKDQGFVLALDDFGVNNSNFTRTKNLKVDIIKIDGLFIKNLDKDKDSQDIVETIVYFAKKAGMKTVAEYVHSKEIFDIIEKLGVDLAQGYYVGEPKPEII